MANISFDQLLTIYRHTVFDAQGDEGTLSITSPEILALLHVINDEEQAGADTNLAVLVECQSLSVGDDVRVRIGAPRLALGLLVRTFDDLMNAPEARLAEPRAYFVIDGCIEKATTPPPAVLTSYRKVLDVVSLFAEAASYLDRTRQELVFFREGKFVVPVRFGTDALPKMSVTSADMLLQLFKDDVHREQKLAILVEAIAHTCEPQPSVRRFTYLMENIAAVSEEVRNGYRLFASSFSYAKIRNELETAKVEYVSKIHKTLIDIQGQLLGIPVATIIVASQLRVADSCGLEFWTNVAVLVGAWVFLALLLIAIVNQWLTLSSIAVEIERQKEKLAADYAAISEQFLDIFRGLSGRIRWHRRALVGVGLIALVGAIIASFAFTRLTTVNQLTCWAGLALHQGGVPGQPSANSPVVGANPSPPATATTSPADGKPVTPVAPAPPAKSP